MNKNNKMELLGNAPIPKALLAMGIPTMLGMMINAVYNLVDAYFVGELGTSQMGAITVAFPLGQVVVGLGLLFGNGAASYLSRLLGRNNKEKASKVASTALYSSILVGALFIIYCLIYMRPIIRLLGATKSIFPYALTYSTIYIASCIFNVFNVTMNNIVTSEGAAKNAMRALMTGAVLNIILDPIFIYVLHQGVAGAAIATAISQCVTTCVYIIYILSKKSVFSFSIRECSYTTEIVSEILKIGIPTLVFQILTSLSITFINMKARPYGDSAIAGMGAVTRIISLGSLMVFGFIKGFQPIAGYNYGAKNYDRLKQSIKISVIWTTIFCAILGLLLVLCSTPIISQFTKGDTRLIEIGSKSLRMNGLSFILFGFYTVYSSLFLALGKAMKGCFLGMCRQGICFIPVILIVPKYWGINGVLYAQPMADLLSAMITVFMALSVHKEISLAKANATPVVGKQTSASTN